MKTQVRKFLWGAALIAPIVAFGSSAMALPLTTGGNNLIGVGGGLAENYVRDAAGLGYQAPSEGGAGAANSQMPGHFESVRVSAGLITGINMAQPGTISAGVTGDVRGTIPNVLIPVAAPRFGTPTWGARSGVMAEILANASIPGLPGVVADNTVTVLAHNFTPSFTNGTFGAFFPGDDGLAPGSVAGDSFPDFAPLFRQTLGLPFNGTDTATVTVSFFGRNDDPSGVLKYFTPQIKIYEGGNPFDMQANAALLALNEADFNHANGTPAGPSLANGVDGNLLLNGEVLVGGTATLIWTFSDTNSSGNFNSGDQVLLDVLVSGGTVEWVSGKLIDDGVVSPGAQGSFGWTLSQEFFVGTSTGTDPNLSQWDFLDLRTAGSNSANVAFEIETAVPEPVTAGLGMISLAGLAAYAVRRRRA